MLVWTLLLLLLLLGWCWWWRRSRLCPPAKEAGRLVLAWMLLPLLLLGRWMREEDKDLQHQ